MSKWDESAIHRLQNGKVCKGCGKLLPLLLFEKDSTKKDGTCAWCRECVRARRHELRSTPESKARQKTYAIKHLSKPENLEKKRSYDRARRAIHGNPHEQSYRKRRIERQMLLADATLSYESICHEFKRKSCPYCGIKMGRDDKSLDHMDPMALGGLHSVCNVIVCCKPCNLTKQAKPFVDWLKLLKPKYQASAQRLYERKHARILSQMPLLFGPVDALPKSKEPKVNHEALARAAWKEWIRDRAPKEWLDEYWSNHPKPWTDPRLTDAEQARLRYHMDAEHRRYQIEKSARNPKCRAWRRHAA